MRKLRWFMLAMLVILAAGAVKADPVDPQIIIRGVATGTVWVMSTPFVLNPAQHYNPNDPYTSCYPVGQGTQPANNPLNLPGWTCEVGNRTGGPITSLLISFTTQTGPLGCVNDPQNLFGNCTTGSSGPGTQFFLFTFGAIPDHTEFYIDFLGFDDPNTSFTIVHNVPEPGALGLCLAGLVAVFGLRRRLLGALPR